VRFLYIAVDNDGQGDPSGYALSHYVQKYVDIAIPNA